VKIYDVGLKFKRALQKRATTEFIILHHAAASEASVTTIHNWHLQRGWTGIGYNFYVRKDGSIYRGRPEDTIGAHTEGYNSRSIGICAEGNFEVETMPDVQKRAIIELLRELGKRYPNAQIKRHKDFAATACPGKNYPLNEIIQAVNKKGSDDVAATLKKGDKGSAVRKLQQDLMTLGYSLAPYGADGSFGKITEEAVKKFQKDNKLAVDGIVGPATQKKIEELLKAKSSKPASDYKKLYEDMKKKYDSAISKLNQIKKIVG